MSLRARLALVLAGVIAGPVVAAGLVVGVVVPPAQAEAGRAALGRAAAALSADLAQQCLSLGDVARSAALDLAAVPAAGRAVDADSAGRAAVAALRGHDDTGVIVVVDGRVVARAGAVPEQRFPPGSEPGADALLLASCSRPATTSGSGSAAAGRDAAVLAESVQLPAVPADAPAVRVVALYVLDAAALDRVRTRLGLPGDVAVLPRVPGPSERPSAGPPAGASRAPARSGTAPVPGAVVRAVTAGGTAGVAAGQRYTVVPAAAGVPDRLVVWAPVDGAGRLRLLLAAAVLVAVLVCTVLLAVVATRLTRPLERLAAAAARLRSGDLSARSGLPGGGDGEVGEVAAALDAMAGRLQGSQDEVRQAKAASADAAARLGEALERTHDLDGLLQTVLDAACATVAAAGGVALLGTERTLEERGAVTADQVPLPPRTTASLGRLARRAVAQAGPVTAGAGEAGAPAAAVPLRSRDRVLGALAVARHPGGPVLTDEDVEALEDLARHAGAAVANALAHEETRRLSVTDPLTGAGNFRQLSTTLAREVERATRFARPLSVVMLDLDHFKAVNDGHGHPFGDAVLREFARRLQDCLREVDTVTRYGGEEFTVVLPETGAEGAAAVAARIVGAVRGRPFAVGARSARVTVSAGVASFPDHGRTASELLRAADRALYAAKAAGRDRWFLAEVAVPGLPDDDLEGDLSADGPHGGPHDGRPDAGAGQGVGAASPGRSG